MTTSLRPAPAPNTEKSSFSDPTPHPDANPCTSCGACCAYFRVSFYWGETDAHPDGHVPQGLTTPINAHWVAMRGTDQLNKRCIALHGLIGAQVSCGIYAERSSTCRAFAAGDDACNRARAHWHLPALK